MKNILRERVPAYGDRNTGVSELGRRPCLDLYVPIALDPRVGSIGARG